MEINSIQTNDKASYINNTGNTGAAGAKNTHNLKDGDTSKANKKHSIKAGELKLPGENFRTIKELFAKKAALKLQIDQFKRDSGMDDTINEHKDKMEQLKEEGNNNQAQINRLEGLKEELKETYGIDDDSEEQKDLAILEKLAGKAELTEDEYSRLSQMGPLTDYQKAALELSAMEAVFQKRVDTAARDYFNEISTITGIKLERLKDDPMVDVNKDAEELLAKVDAEIQQSLIEEIKNRVNENLDIDPEKSILDNYQELIDQKKVTEEDLKGLAVDEKV